MPLDALIIGAGPVGLTLASELTRYGLAVRIIDAAPAPSDKSKALAVWPRTLEHLDRMGLAGQFTAAGLHITQAQFFSGEDKIGEVALDTIASPFPYVLTIPQNQTEHILAAHLATQGVHVERPVGFTSYTEHGDHIEAVLSTGETVTARWLLGCDGAHSAVRHAIGAEFSGDTLASTWALADIAQTPARPVNAVEIHLHPEGVLALFPMPGDRLRMIGSDPETKQPIQRDSQPPAPTLDQIQHDLDARGAKGIVAHDPHWLASFHINERKVADYRRGNAFLAGDAAHVHSPAGGQGMNTGIQDAINLAWKLALVHSGQLTVAGAELLLASYTAERGPVAAGVLKGSGALTRFGTIENRLLQGVRNLAIRSLIGTEFVQHGFAENASELSIAYPDTALNQTSGKPTGPKPGDRAPLTDPNAVSTGAKPVFTLFAPAGPNAEQLIACYPDLFDPQVRPPFAESGIWIARPDGYIGFAGDEDSWPDADQYLGRLKWPQTGQTAKLG